MFEVASQGFLGMAAATAPLRAEALKTWVLSMTDGIVEIELRGRQRRGTLRAQEFFSKLETVGAVHAGVT
jgi:hypothetical protein